ncbi:acetyl-CoA carboxylase biotin carboxyl carrier protein subunit [Reichenbachiella carrageenanivorans]|uniref:Acetyl-CoA carboxylase biotin carboxyl carrier protein subunit n=1 Tax=Reichenbachiella carrageenanivorans TaxID=2979869 RepID=A0ABY6D1F3_9BACT|nr:acetyl-CoA carboxylase biotin carboxyl carrier protein subunit [Reichenbachiella carrageenanivorans]UXX79997.1 acetyl-CoA carboxylase biotin carboxyl carrier protein subunit [Reichenbachiella carrageenanivorans]
MKKAQIGVNSYEIDQEQDQFLLNGQPFNFDLAQSGDGDLHFLVNHKSYQTKVLSVNKEEKTVNVKVNNTPYTVSVKDNLDLLLAKLGMESVGQSGEKDVKAPMPGLILDVLVAKGQEVKKGDHLLILEAMKMENVIKCPSDGVISELFAVKGESVEKGKILLSL